MAEQYRSTDSGVVGSAVMGTHANPDVNVTTAVVTPTDRVRWGPILAGLFAALSTLVLLSVLGAAVAGTAYDAGDPGRAFGIGAGIWGALTALIAFFVGGWLAARSAAVRGHHHGLLNGAMVWAVAIPLMLFLLASGIRRAAGTAADMAQTTVTSAAQVADDVGDDDDEGAVTASAREAAGTQPAGADGVSDPAQQAMTGARQQMERVRQQATPENAERAANAAGRAAWWTLASLLLGLAASAMGGWVGARNSHRDDRDDRDDRDRRDAGNR